MKLKNKRTGEIVDLNGSVWRKRAPGFLLSKYKTMAEFCEEWEDAPEESKPFEEVAKTGFVCYVPIENTYSNSLEIADRDYYEILPDGTKKTEFTWDEAMEIEKKTHGKWRVPTMPEWFAICAAFGRSDDGVDVDPKILKKNLNLTTDGSTGYYWSAASSSTANSYNLYFDGTYLNPRDDYAKGYGFAVRCVAGEGE